MEWIKTSKDLPEYGKHVLVILKWDEKPFMAFRSEGGWECVFPEMGEIKGDAYFDGFFRDKNFGVDVTHWMEIELPKDNS